MWIGGVATPALSARLAVEASPSHVPPGSEAPSADGTRPAEPCAAKA